VVAATEETGSLGVRHLKRFWSCNPRAIQPTYEFRLVLTNTLLAGLQLGLQETLHRLFNNRPSFEDFENWVLEMNGGALDPALVARLNVALSDEGVQGQPADPTPNRCSPPPIWSSGIKTDTSSSTMPFARKLRGCR